MKNFYVKCVLLSLLALLCSKANSVDLNNFAGGGNYHVSVKSFAEMKFSTVYEQQFDFSCGSAALASLLAFHYDDEVNEQSVFLDMYQHGDQEKIKELGFSLLDMKNYLERRSYRSDGFKMELDQLHEADSPAITIIDADGYLHFIIIKGLTEQNVLVGDPAIGVNIIPRDKFEEMWGGRILFMIHAENGIQAKNFQSLEEWQTRLAPLANAIDRGSLSEYHVLMRGQAQEIGAPLDF